MHIIFPEKLMETNLSIENLAWLIGQNNLKIESTIDKGLLWYSENARIVPNSLKIISIEPLNNLRFRLSYQYQWQIFNPCLDIDETEYREESVTFSADAEGIKIEFIGNERPTAADEL